MEKRGRTFGFDQDIAAAWLWSKMGDACRSIMPTGTSNRSYLHDASNIFKNKSYLGNWQSKLHSLGRRFVDASRSRGIMPKQKYQDSDTVQGSARHWYRHRCILYISNAWMCTEFLMVNWRMEWNWHSFRVLPDNLLAVMQDVSCHRNWPKVHTSGTS